MSVDLEMMYKSFVINQVPQLWSNVAYPSLKPLASWVVDLHTRITFMTSWLTCGTPDVFPLPALFFPQGFLTGVLQTHARKYLISINSLKFTYKILDSVSTEDVQKDHDGVFVSGLWMEGMRWEKECGQIADPLPGEMFSLLPTIHFLPSANVKRLPNTYVCPVYKISTRQGQLSTTGISTNFVCAVDLPTNKKEDIWIMRGAACLCNLDD